MNGIKKITIIFLFILNISLSLAANTYTFSFYDENTNSNINNVQGLFYKCSAVGCSDNVEPTKIAEKNSGSTNFLSQGLLGTPNPQDYLEVFLSACYLPRTGVTYGDWGTGQSYSYDVFFSKSQNCHSPIYSYNVLNSVRVNEPLQVDVTAALDANTSSAFRRTGYPPLFTPAGYESDFSATTLITLEIYDSSGVLVNTQSKSAEIIAEGTYPTHFEWVPTVSGDYTAKIKTDVTDCQCENSIEEYVQAGFTVLQNQPLSECYTILNNLFADNPAPFINQSLALSVDKTSNLANNLGILIPVSTRILWTMLNINTTETETFTTNANSNPNSLNPVQITRTWTPENAGQYLITAYGISDDVRCNGINNIPMSTQMTIIAASNPITCTDIDGDTYSQEGGLCGSVDCADTNPNIHPDAIEACNSLDDNCNGIIDEGFGLNQICSAGIGACQRNGTTVCTLDGLNTQCSAVAAAPTAEICNGLDDNCDGQIDEGDVCTPEFCDDSDGSDIFTKGNVTFYVNGAEFNIYETDLSGSDGLRVLSQTSAVLKVSDNIYFININEDSIVLGYIQIYIIEIGFYGDNDLRNYVKLRINQYSDFCADNQMLIEYVCEGNFPEDESFMCEFGCSDGACLASPNCIDNDGDGYNSTGGVCGDVDCDDTDALINLGMTEICNNLDDNCDGQIDEGDVCTPEFCDDSDGSDIFTKGNVTFYVNGAEFNIYETDLSGSDGLRVLSQTSAVLKVSDNIYFININEDSIVLGYIQIYIIEIGFYGDYDSRNYIKLRVIKYIDFCDDNGLLVEFVCYGNEQDEESTTCEFGCSDGACLASPSCTDADADGYNSTAGVCGVVDCDDTNALINPGRAEVCNSLDDNCNSVIDEGMLIVCSSNSNCDDGNLLTLDVCNSPGTCAGSCSYSVIECVLGQTQTQTCGVSNVGECRFGNQTGVCLANNTFGPYSVCIGEVNSTAEVCNGLDDDCDGIIDNNQICAQNLSITISAAPASGLQPLQVFFTSLIISGNPPFQYQWDFGDDTFSNEQNPVHVFYDENIYTAILMVRDNLGKNATASLAISTKPNRSTEAIMSREAIFISSYNVLSNDIKPGGNVEITAGFKNMAGKKVNDATITLSIPELGVFYNAKSGKLKNHETATKNFIVEIPSWAHPGYYNIRLSLDADSGRLKRTEYRQIKIS